MLDPVRVLIVDDSIVVRKAVSDALATDPEISVVGTAANGKIAMERVPQLRPEVLVLDIEMPEANGFDVLRFLKRDHPRIRTIMFSTLTQRGAAQTIEALSLGASDYVSKPSSTDQGGYTDVLKRMAAELVPKIKQFRSIRAEGPGSHLPTGASISGTKPVPSAGFRISPSSSQAIPKIVAIGVSTGGPEALSQLIPKLPKDFQVPLVVVQHMPPIFTKLLAERLNADARVKVREGIDGEVPTPGIVYIAPGDRHMTLARKEGRIVLSMNQQPPENSCRPSADVLFRSVADVYGPNALGVILTGMGHDGLDGLRLMKKKGAVVLAQDQATSVVWGMPAAVVREGLADGVVPIDQMGGAIEAYVIRRK